MRNIENIKKINSNKFVSISALAGAGKTTLLLDYSLYEKNKSITYLCFNQKMSKDSKNKFPKNVSIYTFHAYAFSKIGYNYSHKITNKIPVSLVVDILLLNQNEHKFAIAEGVLREIEYFCQSSYLQFKDMYPYGSNKYGDFGLTRKLLIKYLKIIWSRMEDIEDNFPVLQDFYLKKFHLLNNGHPIIDGDIILVDEVQDINPVIQDIVFKQNLYYNKKIILVGDKNQSIYGFRGSVDVYSELKMISRVSHINMNKTYRFGQKIADLANVVLKRKGEKKNLLIGNEKIKSSVGDVDLNQPYMIISRTNYGVIANLLRVSKRNKTIYVYSNINLFINRMMDIIKLKEGRFQEIVSPEIKRWRSYNQFYAYYKEDLEYSFLFKFIDKYKGNFVKDINLAKSLMVKSPEQASVLLGTLHSVKGLEFNQVILGGDFISLGDNNVIINKKVEEELNLLYTAITRAKEKINISPVLKIE